MGGASSIASEAIDEASSATDSSSLVSAGGTSSSQYKIMVWADVQVVDCVHLIGDGIVASCRLEERFRGTVRPPWKMMTPYWPVQSYAHVDGRGRR